MHPEAGATLANAPLQHATSFLATNEFKIPPKAPIFPHIPPYLPLTSPSHEVQKGGRRTPYISPYPGRDTFHETVSKVRGPESKPGALQYRSGGGEVALEAERKFGSCLRRSIQKNSRLGLEKPHRRSRPGAQSTFFIRIRRLIARQSIDH
jgi:hypothetical protein